MDLHNVNTDAEIYGVPVSGTLECRRPECFCGGAWEIDARARQFLEEKERGRPS